MTEIGSFWARRRAAVQAEAEADTRRAENAQAKARAKQLEDLNEAEVLADLGLPDPDHMQPGDDFSAFMAREVPEYLRRKALRTLWRSNPVLACVDGLNEYDDDYRAAMLLQEPFKTAYQVGKGMLKHIEEMERSAEDVENTGAEDELASRGENNNDTEVAHEAETDLAHVNEMAHVEADSVESDNNVPPPLRRMRFHFEEAAG